MDPFTIAAIGVGGFALLKKLAGNSASSATATNPTTTTQNPTVTVGYPSFSGSSSLPASPDVRIAPGGLQQAQGPSPIKGPGDLQPVKLGPILIGPVITQPVSQPENSAAPWSGAIVVGFGSAPGVFKKVVPGIATNTDVATGGGAPPPSGGGGAGGGGGGGAGGGTRFFK